eukprot:TRINITY_DN2522_c0_g1_i11.p2 TRINITY_DN2522_c0_g1~~TRINITY_DN2522_c0_g1_i11.p2  ORF type:complete len:266 (-),score=96.02 TRINITY_DN2522_c0_g1_i11:3185-3982(-)
MNTLNRVGSGVSASRPYCAFGNDTSSYAMADSCSNSGSGAIAAQTAASPTDLQQQFVSEEKRRLELRVRELDEQLRKRNDRVSELERLAFGVQLKQEEQERRRSDQHSEELEAARKSTERELEALRRQCEQQRSEDRREADRLRSEALRDAAAAEQRRATDAEIVRREVSQLQTALQQVQQRAVQLERERRDQQRASEDALRAATREFEKRDQERMKDIMSLQTSLAKMTESSNEDRRLREKAVDEKIALQKQLEAFAAEVCWFV